MKKLFPLIMGLSVLLSSSSLISVVNSSDPPKQFPIKTQVKKSVNNHYYHQNRAETEIFGQTEYGEEDVVLTIWIARNMWTYWIGLIEKLNCKSVRDSKNFYKIFFANTHVKIKYYKKWNNVKKEVKEGLDQKTELTHATKNFNEVLRAYIENPVEWNIFYKTFIGENNDNNIFPGCWNLSAEQANLMYRRDGQILQIIFIKKESDGSNDSSYIIFQARVFPNSNVVNLSKIWKYIKDVYIDEDGYYLPRWATVIIKIPSPVPSECVKNYITTIWLAYEDKFHLVNKKYKKQFLLFNKTWDDSHGHPKFYTEDQNQTEANMWFYIKDPHDSGKTYVPLGLIVFAEIT